MTATPKPVTPDLFSFESEGFRYEVRGPLLVHADYDSLLLAWCWKGDAPRQAVVLKKMEVPIGREGRTRAVEEVQLAQHLEHPSIGRVLRIAGYLGEPYVVMDDDPHRAQREGGAHELRRGPLRADGAGAHVAFRAPRELLLRGARADPLQSIIAKTLRTNPAERYQSAGELRDDLGAYIDSLRHPFGASEAAEEVKDTLQRASMLKQMPAHPVELDVLPWPKASNVE